MSILSLIFRIALLISVIECKRCSPKRVAVVGEGVIGCSSALALIERDPKLNITVFYETPFETTVSYGPAGLFRVPVLEQRAYAKRAFARYAKLFRELPASETGVNLVSGHILSNNLTALVEQDEIYGEIVYNFHYLREDEMQQFALDESDPRVFAIHYTAYTTEGGKYVPWMKKQLLAKGLQFIQRRLSNLYELYNDFDVIVNCAGLNGGKLAGDGDDRNMFPIRGIIFEDAAVLSEWSGLRPGRHGGIRLESTRVRYPAPKTRVKSSGERAIQIVHNYGHGGHGLTVGWGCGEVVADLVVGNGTHHH